ncbi:MAG: hypothetical protein ACFFG0_00570 [Candidatus Thorarchaeota archaeon]
MALIIGRIKCYFCGEKEGLLHSVHDYDSIYDDPLKKRFFYHHECLEMIEIEPEKFGHIILDRVIHINDLREKCKKRYNNKIISNFKSKVETAKRNSFERMMPKQY